MREAVLHYIWRNRLFEEVTLDGEILEVLDVGRYNEGDGPDFSLAKVRRGDLIWVGSVEMHLKSSDWTAHRHERDPRYDRVILHVVLSDDCEVHNSLGETVPTAVLTIQERIRNRLDELDVSAKALRCTPELSYLSPYSLRSLSEPLLIERIEEKLTRNGDQKDFHELFYRLLMRYLGAHRNNEVMELVASATPLRALRKHASDRGAIESILLGQGGLLSSTPRDAYEAELLEQYSFFRSKFSLTPISGRIFQKLRVRPPAYPARILAIAAQIICREDTLSEAMSSCDFEKAKELLAVAPSVYWRTHIDFGQSYPKVLGGIGISTIHSLLINAVLPVSYLYSQKTGNRDKSRKVLEYYEELPPESNRFIRLFEKNGFAAHTAADTQKMLQLYGRYCESFRCFFCPLAPAIFSALRQMSE